MATIALEYDSNNRVMQKLIEALLELGARKTERRTGLDRAIEEFENGETIVCNDFDDYLKKMRD